MAWVQKDRINLPLASTISYSSGSSASPNRYSMSTEFPTLQTSAGMMRHNLGRSVIRDQNLEWSLPSLSVSANVREVILHAFLPKKIPDCLQPDLNEIEEIMLHHVHKTVSNLAKKTKLDQLHVIGKMMETWVKVHPHSRMDCAAFTQQFQSEVKRLEEGGTLPIFIQRQNATLIINNVGSDRFRLMTYRSSLPAETIMSTVGSLTMKFPETCDEVLHKEALASKMFAKLLYELCTTEFDMAIPTALKGDHSYQQRREVPSPLLVSDWIVGLLTPTIGIVANHKNNNFTKKIRDEVNCKASSTALPFRRSGMWMSIKAALQLKIAELMDNEVEAKFLYKIVMLRILADLCVRHASEEIATCRKFDLSSQMLAKLGGRVGKVEKIEFSDKNSDMAKRLEKMKSTCFSFIHTITTELQERMKNSWNETQREITNAAVINPIICTMKQLRDDTLHQFVQLDDFIKSMEATCTLDLEHPQSCNTSDKVTHYMDLHSILGASDSRHSAFSRLLHRSNQDDFNVRVWSNDAEFFIKRKLVVDRNVTSEILMEILTKYVTTASSYYLSMPDPVGYSQVILCYLVILAKMDIIACSNHPLLLEYHSGVEPHQFDLLLLPHSDDMKLLEKILNYFRGRNKTSVHNGILHDSTIIQDSFTVRYAMMDEEMKSLRALILADTEIAITAKHEEAERVRLECEDLQKQIEVELICTCKWKENEYGRKYKISTCRHCQLSSSLKSLRKTVQVYERPLPQHEIWQHAIVFELRIPKDFSIYRSGLALLNFKIFELTSTFQNSSPPKKWTQYLSRRYNSSSSDTDTVHLGSTSLPASSTQHTRLGNPDVLTNSNDNFIVYNGMDCKYYHSTDHVNFHKGDTKNLCTFDIAKTTSVDKTLYGNLQPMLVSTTYEQNKVIASTSACHRDLAIAEFVAFGSLRAGRHIQIRNLYRSISNRTLSLEKEPVAALILQTLWEVGAYDDKLAIREAHVDFIKENHFTEDFLRLLQNLMESNETNYSCPLIIFNTIMITLRIIELNDHCRQMGYDLLKQCRQNIDTWTKRIDEHVSIDDGNSGGVNSNSLKIRLLEAVICSLLSFNISCPTLLSFAAKDEMDVLHYINSISKFYELKSEKHHTSLSSFMKVLMRIAESVPSSLKAGIFADRTALSNSLHAYASSHWFKANQCILIQEWQTSSDSNVYIGLYREAAKESTHTLTFNFETGEFLVDGYPLSELPTYILSSSLYQLYFQDRKFKVQRDSQGFRTVQPFHEKQYEFRICSMNRRDHQIGYRSVSKNNVSLRILEHCDGRTLQLIMPNVFTGIVANTFVQNYTHWLDVENRVVYFRRHPNGDSYQHEADYIFWKSEEGWKFNDPKAKRDFLSIKSSSFLEICNSFSRIESTEDIRVHMDEESERVTATLPRYKLSFYLENNLLHSIEYPDFKISHRQQFGTFVGLEQGLLLGNNVVNIEGLKKIKHVFIAPHGHLKIGKSSEVEHHRTTINLSSLRSPPFFVFELDSVLKRLTAGKSKAAWLYLTALHAATASSLPDNFTGVTGTEMASWILQSGLVWSDFPYDMESITTLEIIRGFSPVRKYYGHDRFISSSSKSAKQTMETTQWPVGLPELAAYDGFAIIVNRLIEDSKKLEFLHSKFAKSNKTETEFETVKLQIRSYFRHLHSYNPNVSIRSEFFNQLIRENIGAGQVTTLRLRQENSCSQLVSVSQTRFSNEVVKSVPYNILSLSLISYLITSESLSYPAVSLTTMQHFSLNELIPFVDFRTNWLRLYNYAISKVSKSDPEERHAWTVFLSAMAYNGTPMNQILYLHYISLVADQIVFPKIPVYTLCGLSVPMYSSPCKNTYYHDEIRSALQSRIINFRQRNSTYNYSTRRRENEDIHEYRSLKYAYDSQVQSDINRILNAIAPKWPCEKVGPEEASLFNGSNIMYKDSLEQVDKLLNQWYNNYKLTEFVKQVEATMKTATYENLSIRAQLNIQDLSSQFGTLPVLNTTPKVKADLRQKIELTDLVKNITSENELAEITEIFKTGQFYKETNLSTRQIHDLCMSKIKKVRQTIDEQLESTVARQIFVKSGLAPRLSPVFLLQYLMSFQSLPKDKPVINCIGAVAVLWSHLKRSNRCIFYETKGDPCSAELKRELQNPGHENWSPAEHPEWLLLELELDLMIRNVQVEVAQRMMDMPNGKNGVMQLNMGEGKTSVIVPMLCSTLATEDSLCRVTVLNSIFKTNFNILTFTIGGLLNQRVYTFPCNRDMKIDGENVSRVLDAYQDCLKMKGVVLTRPEYRLSFRLKIYDQIIKGNSSTGLELMKIEDFLCTHARDILDESDELLSVKYQLVYTIGAQIPIDGSDMRWTKCQKILKIIQKLAGDLYEKFESSVIEFDKESSQKYPERFAHFRILKNTCQQELYDTVADLLLQEEMLPEIEKICVKKFLIEEEIPSEVHQHLMSYFNDSPDLLNKILIYSGFIRRGVLALALNKRWRVEYGVDSKGLRRMAVPFRAKDVAAERTEFGHPDLAIILTHLSYYYSGLSDNQLIECFAVLSTKLGPETIYRSWIQPIAFKVPKFLSDYRGLNMKDTFQRSKLFKLLSKHKCVIDFWLANRVFPRESKQFPGKIVMTAWDLCYERNNHPVCGFSGTNDSKILLPLPITQQDLDMLHDTNSKMEETLLQPENGNHKSFKMGVTCREILVEMKKNNLKVLIDSGALMLDCDNEQVAELWLEVDPEIEAAVYFNTDNEILVKCRGESSARKGKKYSNDIPLELSPFRGRLGLCGVFLDDQHTRGTDLKFPRGSRAAVTIGTRMRRDKLMQACMRMRKLIEKDHSVSFYLSHEARDKVILLKKTRPAKKQLVLLNRDKKLEEIELQYSGRSQEILQQVTKPSPEVETADVIEWVTLNTKEFNQDGLLYWTTAGRNYSQKLAADQLFHSKTMTAETASILARQCVDDEVTMLKDMYGQYTTSELLVRLIPKWFEITKKKLQITNGRVSLPVSIISKVNSTCDSIVKRCLEHVPEKTHVSTMIEEEQEKELEKEAEVEEEREVERPKKAEAASPTLHQNVVNTIVCGNEISVMPGIKRVSDIFANTLFSDEIQYECWGKEVYATEDFISVIKPLRLNRTDSHLRPIEYLVVRESSSLSTESFQVLIISPYETNRLMPLFRTTKTKLQLRMFTTRTFEKQDLLVNNWRLHSPHSIPISNIPEGSRAMAALLVASGSMYFNSMEEQQAFARFLGLVPQPWSAEHTRLFEREMISKTGFLSRPFRQENFELCQIELSAFIKDPTSVVKMILNCRHPVVSEVAHVVRLLDKTLYVEIC